MIHSIDELDTVIKEKNIEIGVIATPAVHAQATARRLIDAGIKAILNFAPLQIQMPEGFIVENVDFTVKLDNLAYHLTMEAI